MATASAPRLEPVTLEGSIVRLEPLSLDHVPALAEVALDPAIWRWTIARPTSEAELRAWAETTIAARAAGTELPFATIDRVSGRPIGSSRYMNIALDHRRIEIGWTWVGTAFQRTGANREAKLLMLGHAFDTLGCRRVEFKTDALNERARAALAALPSRFEGTFRKHMLMYGGRWRDSAWYAITDEEWPETKRRLRDRLAAQGAREAPPPC